jgi:hypothetical protein
MEFSIIEFSNIELTIFDETLKQYRINQISKMDSYWDIVVYKALIFLAENLPVVATADFMALIFCASGIPSDTAAPKLIIKSLPQKGLTSNQ